MNFIEKILLSERFSKHLASGSRLFNIVFATAEFTWGALNVWFGNSIGFLYIVASFFFLLLIYHSNQMDEKNEEIKRLQKMILESMEQTNTSVGIMNINLGVIKMQNEEIERLANERAADGEEWK